MDYEQSEIIIPIINVIKGILVELRHNPTFLKYDGIGNNRVEELLRDLDKIENRLRNQ